MRVCVELLRAAGGEPRRGHARVSQPRVRTPDVGRVSFSHQLKGPTLPLRVPRSCCIAYTARHTPTRLQQVLVVERLSERNSAFLALDGAAGGAGASPVRGRHAQGGGRAGHVGPAAAGAAAGGGSSRARLTQEQKRGARSQRTAAVEVRVRPRCHPPGAPLCAWCVRVEATRESPWFHSPIGRGSRGQTCSDTTLANTGWSGLGLGV